VLNLRPTHPPSDFFFLVEVWWVEVVGVREVECPRKEEKKGGTYLPTFFEIF
jgi:hypothetical protein